MSLLLCPFFYPLSAQIYIRKTTPSNLKDTVVSYIIERGNSENILYITKDAEIYNPDKPSNAGKTLQKDFLAKTRHSTQIKKEKKQVDKSLPKVSMYYVPATLSFFYPSEPIGKYILFTTTAAFYLKQGITPEKYRSSVRIKEHHFAHHYSRAETFLKMNFCNTRIRPPPF